MHGQFFHIMHGFFNAKDISTAWLGLDKNLGRHAFRVDLSKDYNLVVKEEFLEAIRGLVGIFRYFLSGEAKVGAFQVAFSWQILHIEFRLLTEHVEAAKG